VCLFHLHRRIAKFHYKNQATPTTCSIGQTSVSLNNRDDLVDGFPSKGIWTPCADQMEEKEKNAAIDQNRNDFPNASTIHFLDLEHGISQQVFDSLHHADELFQEPLRDAKNTS
jgi:hypothetical protein